MSVGFRPKNEHVEDRELSVQELAISGLDYELYTPSVGTPIVVNDPFLLTAGNFAALGSSAVSNTGSSVLTGDLGISPAGSITGFPPGTFSGTLHNGDLTAAQAKIDAQAGYTALAAHSSTTIPSALDGQTLTAGYYSFASGAATLANSAPGTLTLSGSATDIFVIKTASTYTSGAGGAATVALTGGALAKNVYWVIGSSATINISGASTHRGNIIAQASITVTSGGASDVQGSLIALTGAVTFSAATTVERQSQPTSTSTINLTIPINEPVKNVKNAFVKTDASNSMYNFDIAHTAIIDSKNTLSGLDESNIPVSDRKFIQLLGYPGSSFPANDVIVVKYVVQKHL